MRTWRTGFIGLSLAVAATLMAQGCWAHDPGSSLNIPPVPAIGSSNVADAALLVSHPASKPCVVQLFKDATFANFSPLVFHYAPPAACRGPWAKVVFTGQFSVSAGRQYDRTANVFLGGANLFFGTTPEPRSSLSPSWTVQTDVTRYAALLRSNQIGQVNLGNLVNSTYTGVITGSGTLTFYPGPSLHGAGGHWNTSGVDMDSWVYGLNTGNAPAGLDTGTDRLSATLVPPRNLVQLDMDVIAQSQGNDEFWYTCVPDDLSSQLQSCGGTGYRAVQVYVDGKLAGLAPVSPWIYTGGIDPYLWTPIPGVQTLNFHAYRVDLTPFVGLLDDGQAHTVSVGVAQADQYFSVAATLVGSTDPRQSVVQGGLIGNSNTPPQLQVTSSNGGNALDMQANGSFWVKGYIRTRHGMLVTTVRQKATFDNRQQFDITDTDYMQSIQLDTRMDRTTTVQGPMGQRTTQDRWQFPLALSYAFVQNADGSYTQTTTVDQHLRDRTSVDGLPTSQLDNHVHSADSLQFSAAFALTGHDGTGSRQDYAYTSGRFGHPASCYRRSISAADNAVTQVSTDTQCRPSW